MPLVLFLEGILVSGCIFRLLCFLEDLEQKKLNMNNQFFIDGSNLYKEVMLIKYYDVFQIAIYQ